MMTRTGTGAVSKPWLVLAVVAAVLLLAADRCLAEEPQESLDSLLTRAMEKNPGILAAKARLALAEAELRSARMEVARQVIALRSEQPSAARALDAARRELRWAEELLGRKQRRPEQVSAARAVVLDAEARVARIQSDLRLLTGQLPAGLSGIAGQGAVVQIPHGPEVDAVRKAMDLPISVELEADTRIQDLLDFLADSNDLRVLADYDAIGDLKLGLYLKKVRLRAVLQSVEDLNPSLQFVVREYGLLLTTRDRARERGYLPLAEFLRENKPAASKGPSEK